MSFRSALGSSRKPWPWTPWHGAMVWLTVQWVPFGPHWEGRPLEILQRWSDTYSRWLVREKLNCNFEWEKFKQIKMKFIIYNHWLNVDFTKNVEEVSKIQLFHLEQFGARLFSPLIEMIIISNVNGNQPLWDNFKSFFESSYFLKFSFNFPELLLKIKIQK
jgi:hypothetical protein